MEEIPRREPVTEMEVRKGGWTGAWRYITICRCRGGCLSDDWDMAETVILLGY